LGIAHGVDSEADAVGASLRKAIPVKGLADQSIRSAPFTAGGVTVIQHITVQGHVTTEKKLAEAIAPSVRDAIVRKGKNNGGRTGF